MKLIAVVMGSKTSHGPESSFGVASRLFTNAFAQYYTSTVLKKGAKVGEATVVDGASKTVPAVASSDVSAMVKRGEEGQVKVAFHGGSVTAPVRAGQQVGSITITAPGSQQKVPAIAGASVDKQAWWRKFWPF